jgi:hypothetical protein
MFLKSIVLLAAFTHAEECAVKKLEKICQDTQDELTDLNVQLKCRNQEALADYKMTTEMIHNEIAGKKCELQRTLQKSKIELNNLHEALKYVAMAAKQHHATWSTYQKDVQQVADAAEAQEKLKDADCKVTELEEELKHIQDKTANVMRVMKVSRRRGAAIVSRRGDGGAEGAEGAEGDEDTEVAVVDEPCPKLMMKHRLQGFAAGSLIMALIILFIVPMFGAKDDTPAPAPAPAATDTDAAEVIAADATADAAAADATAGAAAAAAAAADPTNSTVEPEVVSCTLSGTECTSGTACIDDTSGTACIDESVSCSCSVRRRRLSQRKLSSRRWR